jgi:death on curing protein
MRYLKLEAVLLLHDIAILQTGGISGIRDLGALKSAVAQPLMTFDGIDLYRSLEEKSAALGFSLICNHPFIDGNKRVAHASIESFLVLNGFKLEALVDESEAIILNAAAGKCSRDEFVKWIEQHIQIR